MKLVVKLTGDIMEMLRLSIILFSAFVFQSVEASDGSNPMTCIITHCMTEVIACQTDAECKGILDCMGECEPDDTGCAYECGMTGDAGKNPHYLDLLYCMIDNDCMDRYPNSGMCIAGDLQAIQTEDFGLVAGEWWTVYGQSCGQTEDGIEWNGAYDWVPCSHARFYEVENGDWVNNTTFCYGSDSVCDTPIEVTVPIVYWDRPGVLRHDYPQSEAPLVPQIEDWKWMYVNGDWAFVVWCAHNPILIYNGAFVLSRNRSDGTMPEDVEIAMREEIAKYGLKLETMCLTDSTWCDPN